MSVTQSDREIRSTMLHEMGHLAANDAAGPDHGSKFLAQIESLLRQKAPLTIGFPEAPQVGYLVWRNPQVLSSVSTETEQIKHKRAATTRQGVLRVGP